MTKPLRETPELSRRSLLGGIATAAAGAAVFGAVMTTNIPDAAAKSTQKAVGYQDSPKGALRCDNCVQFQPPSSCKVVDGTIAPEGWCKVYIKKPA